MCNHIKNLFGEALKNQPGASTVGIIMIGDPACGKGTQAKMMINAHPGGGCHFSTGQLGREECEKNVVFRETHGVSMKAGDYFPDKVALELVQNAIPSIPSGQEGLIVCDGFPRNDKQGAWIGSVYCRPGLLLAFCIKVSEATTLARSKTRFEEERRPDDYNEEIILNRRRQWNRHKKKLIRKLESQGIVVVPIDGEMTKEKVHEAIMAEIKKHQRKLKRVVDRKQARLEDGRPRLKRFNIKRRAVA